MNGFGRHLKANVVGYIALFFALGLGSAWAATELSRNEVKSKHIGKGQVRKSDLAANAVNASKVANGSLSAEDFAAGSLPAGPQGPPGDQGPPGTSATSLWAVVNASGQLARGSGVVTSAALFDGVFGSFEVVFNRDITSCALLATIGRTDAQDFDPPPGQIGTAYRNGNPNAAYVKVLNSAGAGTDQPFHLAVLC